MNIFLLLVIVALVSFVWGACHIIRSYQKEIAMGDPLVVKGKVYIAVEQKLSPVQGDDQ